MEPPARNSMWRFGYPNPVDYNDNELYCGGYSGQYFLIFFFLVYGCIFKSSVNKYTVSNKILIIKYLVFFLSFYFFNVKGS